MVTLRPATFEDAGRLLSWRNDPATRNASFNRDEVVLADHETWLREKLADAGCRFWIAEVDGAAIGQTRLDVNASGIGEISFSVAPDMRGRGIGTALLRAVVSQANDDPAIAALVARVREDNAASVAAFVRAGFQVVEDEESGEHRFSLETSSPRGK